MKLVSVEQMKRIETEADEAGLTFKQMMLNAGMGLARMIHRRYGRSARERSILGLIGPGNNGGDTIIALAELKRMGWDVRGYAFQRKPEQTEGLLQSATELSILHIEEDESGEGLNQAIHQSSFVLDGLLGTGTHLPLKKPMAAFLAHVNELITNRFESPIVIAIDCPSGVDCSSGAVDDRTIHAAVTGCMGGLKLGLLSDPGRSFCGEIEMIDIHLPESLGGLQGLPDVIEPTGVKRILPIRNCFSHKGSFGKVVIAGGSINYTGAPALSALGACRVGSGLVSLAVPETLYNTLSGRILDCVWQILPSQGGVISREAAVALRKYTADASAVLIGPGLGREKTSIEFVLRYLFNSDPISPRGRIGFVQTTLLDKPSGRGLVCIVDADGLYALSQQDEWWKHWEGNGVLTPHPGEMSLLTGLSVEQIQKSRLEIAAEYAKKWHKTVVLKGAHTVVADPVEGTALSTAATSALAHAGSGDVLSGIITGLLGQGLSSYAAATAGVAIHARAGYLATRKTGCESAVLASDLSEWIGPAIEQITNW